MRMIGLLADKLLSGVVPQIKAAACCGGADDLHRVLRRLRNGVGLRMTCVITCTGGTSCGAFMAGSESSCRG